MHRRITIVHMKKHGNKSYASKWFRAFRQATKRIYHCLVSHRPLTYAAHFEVLRLITRLDGSTEFLSMSNCGYGSISLTPLPGTGNIRGGHTGLIVHVTILSDTCRHRSQENIGAADATTVGRRAVCCIDRFAYAGALIKNRLCQYELLAGPLAESNTRSRYVRTAQLGIEAHWALAMSRMDSSAVKPQVIMLAAGADDDGGTDGVDLTRKRTNN